MPTELLAAEPSRIFLRLRDDLAFTPQTSGGCQWYVVEDRLSGKCYRLGVREYRLAAALDGRTSLADARMGLQQADGEPLLTEADALRAGRWLVSTGLARSAGEQQASSPQHPRRAAIPNPIFIRVPLFAPERILDRLLPWCGSINSATGLGLTVLLWVAAAVHLASGWDRFIESAGQVFSLEQGFFLLVGWIALKILHELGHALACRYYGGYVREAGVALLLLAPIPYVDVTSSWRLRSKWVRIHVAAAGMIVEAIAGSLAVLVWSYLPDGVWSQVCINIVTMATATTLLFNANPLMRFDGYYILTDLLELPNLYSRGQQFVSSRARRWLLGETAGTPPAVPRVVRWYGVAAASWRVAVCLSLIVAAAALFHGAGIILAALAALSWLVVPAFRLLRSHVGEKEPRRRWRPVVLVAAATAIGAALMCCTPWPFPRRSPGIVEYEPLSIARAGSAGFVSRVHVAPGQQVAAGQLLAELENPELCNQLALLQVLAKESKLRSRIYRQRGEIAAQQAEMERLSALEKQAAEKQAQVDALSIYADSAGRVVGRTLPHLQGTYLAEGAELCRIGLESAKQLQLSIHQDDVASFQQRVGRRLTVRSPHGVLRAELTAISPRATEHVNQLALCASHGGPLPVRQVTDTEASPSVVLLEPRFIGHVALGPDDGRTLRAGQLCTATVRSPGDSIAAVLAKQVRGWLASDTRR